MHNESTTQSYQDVIARAKIVARDILRVGLIINLMEKRHALEQELEQHNEDIAAQDKKLAIAAFNLKQAEANEDPRLEDVKKTFEAVKTCVEDCQKEINLAVERAQERIKTLNEDIAKVESGEKKVSYDNLIELTKTLVTKHYENVSLSA